MKTDAIAATQFLSDRSLADLPVPSGERVERARRLTEQNPALRHMRTPLGLLLLALRLPTTRHERRKDGVELKPVLSRGKELSLEASRAAVDAFVEANPGMQPLEAAEAISRMSGYDSPSVPMRRVSRFLRSTRGGRMPGHVREKALLLSAVAQAADAIAKRDAGAEA